MMGAMFDMELGEGSSLEDRFDSDSERRVRRTRVVGRDDSVSRDEDEDAFDDDSEEAEDDDDDGDDAAAALSSRGTRATMFAGPSTSAASPAYASRSLSTSSATRATATTTTTIGFGGRDGSGGSGGRDGSGGYGSGGCGSGGSPMRDRSPAVSSRSHQQRHRSTAIITGPASASPSARGSNHGSTSSVVPVPSSSSSTTKPRSSSSSTTSTSSSSSSHYDRLKSRYFSALRIPSAPIGRRRAATTVHEGRETYHSPGVHRSGGKRASMAAGGGGVRFAVDSDGEDDSDDVRAMLRSSRPQAVGGGRRGGGDGDGGADDVRFHPIQSAPTSSNPIPISSLPDTSPLDPDEFGTSVFSQTFVPPHQIVGRSEFSVWDKNRRLPPPPESWGRRG